MFLNGPILGSFLLLFTIFSIAREFFFELSLFYCISSNVSVEEGYAIVMVNLDYWFFKGGHKKVESEYKHFKANLFLADPMMLV